MGNPDLHTADGVAYPVRWHGKSTVATGGQPPHDGLMEARVAKLEDTMTLVRERLARIETSLAHTATKDQVEGVRTAMEGIRSDLIKWFVGTALVLASLAFTAAKFMH